MFCFQLPKEILTKRQSNNSSVFIYLYEFEYIEICISHISEYITYISEYITCSICINTITLLITSKHEIIIIRYKHCNREKVGC